MRITWVMSSLVAVTLLGITPTYADSASTDAPEHSPYTSGADIYHHVCQGCHMPDAKGTQGLSAHFPALAGNMKLQNATYPAYVLLNGFGGMPSFANFLSDDQIANVVNYVRTHFGNQATDTLTPEQVSTLRQPVTVSPAY